MNKLFKKYYKSILIDFSFLVVLYFFLLFLFTRMRDYFFKIQDYGFNFKQVEGIIQENMSMLDYNLILSNVQLLNLAIQKIMIMFFIALVGSFILYCLFQGLQWSFILKNKFKEYIWKFSLISFVSYSLSFLFIFQILSKVKPILLNYFSGLPVFSLSVKIVFLIILILILWYYTSIIYVFLGKNSILKALKKSFLFDKKSIFAYLISVVLIFLIVYLFSKFSLFGWFYWIIELILIIGIINYYRYFLKSKVL